MSHQLGFANRTPNSQACLVTAAAGHHAAMTTHNSTQEVLVIASGLCSTVSAKCQANNLSNQLMALTIHAIQSSMQHVRAACQASTLASR